MSELELTQASVLKPVVTTLRRRGIDVKAYLDAFEIPAELLQLPYAPLAKRNQIWAFLEAIELKEGLETLGFLLGDPMDLRETGPFGDHISNAATLYDALQTVRRLMPDFSQGNQIRVRRGSVVCWISMRTPQPKSRPADHYALKFLIAIARLAAGPKWVPRRATLQTGEVPAIFELPHCRNCRIEFNAPDASIEIPATLLSAPPFGRNST